MEVGLEYFRLQLKAEYEEKKALMSATEFKEWYDSLLARMQSTGAQGQEERESWLGIN